MAQIDADVAAGEYSKEDADLLRGTIDDTFSVRTDDLGRQVTTRRDLRGFLSSFQEAARYTGSRLLGSIRKASESAAHELGGEAEESRESDSTPLGAFSGYRVDAEVVEPDSLHPDGHLRIEVFGKEQLEAELTDSPALVITLAADGELVINGPDPQSDTFKEFQRRGWADYARDGEGNTTPGWTRLLNPKDASRPLPISQLTPLLADARARLSLWQKRDQVGIHWTRSTGATGGMFGEAFTSTGGRQAAVFFQGARGSFSPESLTITLLEGADLSTVLHEAAHFFFENDIALASEITARVGPGGYGTLTAGEKQLLADVSALLTKHGIEGDVFQQLTDWHRMDFEERRGHHERTAEMYERYLAEGRAPSLALQPYFQRFSTWMLRVYQSVKAFIARHPEAGQLDDTVRGVFDRMLASQEQIALAQQARSMLPLFANPEQGGMSPAEFADYQALGADATAGAVEDLQAKGLRDMRWLHNAHSRHLKRLQREAAGLRREVRTEVRAEVMRQPVYQAWQFLTGKQTDADRFTAPVPPKFQPGPVDPSVDSLFVAIAKLGGLDWDAAAGDGWWDSAGRSPMPIFGKPLLRRQGGRSPDDLMAANRVWQR